MNGTLMLVELAKAFENSVDMLKDKPVASDPNELGRGQENRCG